MNLIKCEHEHYFDADKFDSCPHCANIAANATVSDIFGKRQQQIETVIPEEDILQNYHKISHRKVTGWLVCIEGLMQGESFTLYEGTNHIGRAPHMDIALFKEATVSRENHAVITYDKNTRIFSLEMPEQSGNAVTCNGKAVISCLTLHAYDTIQLGDCSLSFIPFCGEHFTWK